MPMPRSRVPVRVTLAAAMVAIASGMEAQIRVNPTTVDVNSQGPTTVFLTYGFTADYQPAEAVWCRDLISAAPAVGLRCDPTRLWGELPEPYNLSRSSGIGVFTHIMSMPASVARRAYQAAAGGATGEVYYVRHFASKVGAPDQFVVVTLRLTGGGARVPLSLTDVTMAFDVETPVLYVARGERPPPFAAQMTYTGTGRLVGRWEVVRPGEELPEAQDLLTEATLPLEERGTQRRYTELARFNFFLPPTGRFTLRGPDMSRLPVDVEGTYLILLRVEASDDKEGDSDLADAGTGAGVVHSGAVAGFPLPTLRYVVGSGGSEQSPSRASGLLQLVVPAEDARVAAGQPMTFSWSEDPRAATYRLEIETLDGGPILTAFTQRGVTAYRTPPFLAERAAGRALQWRVVALDGKGSDVNRSVRRRLALPAAP